jgi:hypothetical protein
MSIKAQQMMSQDTMSELKEEDTMMEDDCSLCAARSLMPMEGPGYFECACEREMDDPGLFEGDMNGNGDMKSEYTGGNTPA